VLVLVLSPQDGARARTFFARDESVSETLSAEHNAFEHGHEHRIAEHDEMRKCLHAGEFYVRPQLENEPIVA
jgi:hypothetical protein